MEVQGLGDVLSLAQGRTQGSLSTDVKRLSSGLRINTAADDPSGLAISEKLQTQVNGLDAGVQNVQDANNALNIADGALSTISDILQRVRALVVEGTSDLKTPDDKASLQVEIDQLTKEINQVSQNTTYNGKQLLDGSLSSAVPLPGRIIVPQNGSLASGGTLLDSTVDPSQPSFTQFDSPQFAQSLSVDSYDPSTGLLSVTVNIEGSDPSQFGPAQLNVISVQAGTNYQVGDAAPTPGTPEFNQATGSGETVLGFNIGTLSAADVGQTAVIVSLNAQTKAPGQALEINSGSNEGATVGVDIPAVNTINLGVNDIQLSDNFSNQASEYRVDYGINALANIRAQIGAQTVSLQQTANDSSITAVNDQAAQSSIADTNIAQTTTDFTKQQILTSIQSSLLSQVNTDASFVLQLVRGAAIGGG